MPVGSYTGIPKIEVPLFNISVRDLTLPVSLSYHAGGFRVADEASWVGLGWTLNAGGSISRTIKDKDDFHGWLRADNPPLMDPKDTSPSTGTGRGSCNSFFFGDVYTGKYGMQNLGCIEGYQANGVVVHHDLADAALDWEPDNFSYSFGPHAGQFVFNQQGEAAFLQKEKLRLTYNRIPNSSAITWQAIDAAGYQYFFEASGSSYAESGAMSNFGETDWYLTKIHTPQGEEASFSYELGNNIVSQPTQSKYDTKERTGTLVPGESTTSLTNSYSHSIGRYLRRIDFSTGYLVLERNSQPRLDLEGGESLQGIKLFASDGTLVKEVVLNTSYFTTPPALTTNNFSPSNTNTFKDKRLRLDAVLERGAQGASLPATTFTYNPAPLPSKTSYDIDYWGYYNGRKFNTDLLPRYEGILGVSGTYGVIPGADRTPDANAMQALVLQKITYPTGGSTTYTFEPNQYSNLDSKDLYENTGQQTYSCIRDDGRPFYNTPVQTLIIANQRPQLGNQLVQVHVNLLFSDNIPDDYSSKGALRVELTGPDGFLKSWGFTNAEYYDNTITSKQVNEFVGLPPGTYQLTAYSPGTALTYPRELNVRGDLSVPTYHQRINMVTGGLRAAKIVSRDALSHQRLTRRFDYATTYVSDDTGQAVGVSSGIIMSKPLFARTIDLASNTHLFQLCSSSLTPVSATIGYGQVTTYLDSLSSGGKVVQYFTNLAEREPTYAQRTPGVPNRHNLSNGNLIKEDLFRNSDILTNSYELVKSTATTYEEVATQEMYPIYRGALHMRYGAGAAIYADLQDMYAYPVATGWVRPVTTVTSSYGASGSTTQTTELRYDERQVGHMQVTTRLTERSDGSHEITALTYPADYTAVTTGPLAEMRRDEVYQHSAIVESITQTYGPTETLAQARTIAGTYTEYAKPNTTSAYLPVTEQTLEVAQPTGSLGAAAPSLPPAGRYQLRAKLSYEPGSANVRQLCKAHGTPTSVLWGYNNSVPVAKLVNASASQVTSALTTLGFTPTTLPTAEQDLRQLMIQLRQRLPQARITSYTHRPLIGLSSQTDATGRTFFYEYDEFGRLVRTRDEQGRILTQDQYHYARH